MSGFQAESMRGERHLGDVGSDCLDLDPGRRDLSHEFRERRQLDRLGCHDELVGEAREHRLSTLLASEET